MTENLEVTDEGGVRVVAFDRPEKKNALTEEMAAATVRALEESASSAAIRVVVVTGKGGAFSAGVDLSVLEAAGETGATPVAFSALGRALRDFEKPLLAAVDGLAVGMAVTLLPAFDMVYASARSEALTPFSRLGLSVEYGGSVTFPRLMGRQRASEILLRGERLGAETLAEWGLFTRVFPSEGFMDQVLSIAREIAALPPGAVAATKRLLRDGEERSLDEALAAEDEELAARFRSDEMRHALEGRSKR